MSFVSMCFRCCGYGLDLRTTHLPKRDTPLVRLDTSKVGQDVVIIKNGTRICGTGTALATSPIVQSKAYFEVKLQQGGVWGIGLATLETDLNRPLGEDVSSWVLWSDGTIRHNQEVIATLSDIPKEGDVVGITYDHIELNYYLNGVSVNCPIIGVKGMLYPAVYVDDAAILDAMFENCHYAIPAGFDTIMLEKSLL